MAGDVYVICTSKTLFIIPRHKFSTTEMDSLQSRHAKGMPGLSTCFVRNINHYGQTSFKDMIADRSSFQCPSSAHGLSVQAQCPGSVLGLSFRAHCSGSVARAQLLGLSVRAQCSDSVLGLSVRAQCSGSGVGLRIRAYFHCPWIIVEVSVHSTLS